MPNDENTRRRPLPQETTQTEPTNTTMRDLGSRGEQDMQCPESEPNSHTQNQRESGPYPKVTNHCPSGGREEV